MQRIFILISVIFFVACVPISSEKEIKISPAVRFQGNWLIIKNNDTFSYDFVKVGINGGTFKKELPFSIPAGIQVKYDLSI